MGGVMCGIAHCAGTSPTNIGTDYEYGFKGKCFEAVLWLSSNYEYHYPEAQEIVFQMSGEQIADYKNLGKAELDRLLKVDNTGFLERTAIRPFIDPTRFSTCTISSTSSRDWSVLDDIWKGLSSKSSDTS